MLIKTLSVFGLLALLSTGAMAAEPSRQDEEGVSPSGRAKESVSRCRKPGDINPTLPRCTLTSLPEAKYIDSLPEAKYHDSPPKPRPMPSCVERGDCIVSPFVKGEGANPPMDGREGVGTVNSGSSR